MAVVKLYESADEDAESQLSVMELNNELILDTFDSADTMVVLSRNDALDIVDWIHKVYGEK